MALRYYTEIVETKGLATFLNRMLETYGDNWHLVNLTSVQDGYVIYVTVLVEEAEDEVAEGPEPYKVPQTLWNAG